MPFVFMTDRATGRCALFEENGTTGDVTDPNSVRNAPLNSPVLHLDKIRFHSDWDYYLVEIGPTTVSVNHPALGGGSNTITLFPSVTRLGTIGVVDHVLLTHNLGYAPAFAVISGDALIGPGSDIQSSADTVRNVTPYATSTIIGLRDLHISGSNTLPAITRSYTVIVFRDTVAENDYLIDYVAATDSLTMGLGKFRADKKALRRTLISDASPFDISTGRTVDIKNGGSRTVLADGTTFTDPWYNGTFTGSPSIQCTVE